MFENKGLKIIELLVDLYSVSEKDAEKMRLQSEEYNSAFKDYFLDDIQHAVKEFWRWKSDKSRPKVSQILAILETKNLKKDDFAQDMKEPSTNIQSLQDSYLKICETAHILGITCFEFFEKVKQIPSGIGNYIKKLPSGESRIYKYKWDWKDAVSDAKKIYKDQFDIFPNMNDFEQYTMAYKLGFIKL